MQIIKVYSPVATDHKPHEFFLTWEEADNAAQDKRENGLGYHTVQEFFVLEHEGEYFKLEKANVQTPD